MAMLPQLTPSRVPSKNFQAFRHFAQYAFIAINLCIGLQFYLWVRYYERGGQGLQLPRPAGVEGWLPIAGLMNFKLFLATGSVPTIHPAAMFLFLAFCTASLVAKKSFCSWLCPIGALSEHLARLGRRLFGRNFRLPRPVDLPLRGLKYLLLSFFLFAVGSMSADRLAEFLTTPYGLIADVKMLNFFRGIGLTAALALATLTLLSLLVEGVWCRYLCPYGALLGLVSLASPLKVRRQSELCTGCGACARHCPAALPVDRLVQVRSAECTACMLCIDSCPTPGALRFSLPGTPSNEAPRFRRPVTPAGFALLLACIFFGFVLFARATGHWQSPIPPEVYQSLIPNAGQSTHPGLE